MNTKGRPDVSAGGFWINGRQAVFYVRVLQPNPTALRYIKYSTIYRQIEKKLHQIEL